MFRRRCLRGGRQAFTTETFADHILKRVQMLASDLGPQAVLDAAAEYFRLPGQNAGCLGIHCATCRLERLPAQIERALLDLLQVGCIAAGREHQCETGHQNSTHHVFPLSLFVKSPGQPEAVKRLDGRWFFRSPGDVDTAGRFCKRLARDIAKVSRSRKPDCHRRRHRAISLCFRVGSVQTGAGQIQRHISPHLRHRGFRQCGAGYCSDSAV
jgi:hypothetical protein